MAIEGWPDRRCLQCGRAVDTLLPDRPGCVPTGFTLPFGDGEVWETDECEVPSCPCIGPDAERDWFAPLRPDFMHTHLELNDFDF